MKRRIYWRKEISCAHKLNLPYESKCTNLHGHGYLVEIWVEGKKNKQGMIIDFSLLKEIVMRYDHKYLNDFLEQPTVENLAEMIYEDIKKVKKGIKVKVRIWEDRDSYAEVTD